MTEPALHDDPARARRRLVVGALSIVVMTLLAYLPAINGGFIWDDPRYVTDNHLLESIGGLGRIWFDLGATVQYYPMVFTTFWIEHQLWGLHPLGYHLDNVILHALSSLVLWRILRRLEVPGAWVAAAIFAVHPVHVESVAWITERKNVLSGLFYLTSAYAYLRFARLGETDDDDAPDRRWLALAVVLFVGALLSKTVTASLPAALLLVVWWKRGTFTRRDLATLLPMLVLGLAAGLLTAWIEKTNVRAVGADWEIAFLHRCLIATRAPWFYVGKLVLPAPLIFFYPRWDLEAVRWWWYLFPLATVALLVAAWVMRGRFGRGPLVAILFFGGTLFPALGFVNTYPMRYSFVADHFQYLASIGVIALLVGGITYGVTRRAEGGARPVPRPLLAVVGVVLLTFMALTWRESRQYESEETLYRTVLAKHPDCWIALNNLGLIIMRDDPETARAQFERALELKPNFQEAMANLGILDARSGSTEDAIARWRQVLETKPDDRMAHGQLGRALEETGDLAGALDHFEQQVERTPGSADARVDLARALGKIGRVQEAIFRYEEVLGVDPEHRAALSELAALLLDANRIEPAIAVAQRAVAAAPQAYGPQLTLGEALAKAGRARPAIAAYRAALDLEPDLPPALFGLGSNLARTGAFDESIAAFRRLAEVDPGNADVHANLGILLLRQGRPAEAEQAFVAALAANPDHARAKQELARLRGGG